MRNAIIVHGSAEKEEFFSDRFPSLSNSHWIPWLQKQLIINGVLTQTPEMSVNLKPDYSEWKKEFEKFPVNEETLLVGFSCGGGFLLRWLSENQIKVGKLILVAPWLDPSRRETDTFFDFTLDFEIQNRISKIHLLVSEDDDTEGIKESVEKIRSVLPQVELHRFKDKGHFTFEDMKTEKFPELLEIVLS